MPQFFVHALAFVDALGSSKHRAITLHLSSNIQAKQFWTFPRMQDKNKQIAICKLLAFLLVVKGSSFACASKYPEA